MKLYTHALSPFSGKVRIALDEKGVAIEEEQLPITRQAVVHKPKEMLDANPRGEVPTLVADGLVLYDSTVILEWLEERHPSRRCSRAVQTPAPGRGYSKTTATGS